MTCKDYIQLAHHGFNIIYDDDDSLSDIKSLSQFKQRATNEYTVSKEDYKKFERGMDTIQDFNCPMQNASMLRRPQGIKGTARGYSFDSVWEFAYFIWMRDIRGEMCERNKVEYVTYIDDDTKSKRWYPDFKIATGYSEIKGIMRPKDFKKMEQHPEIEFITGDKMKLILEELKQKIPNWRNEYMES